MKAEYDLSLVKLNDTLVNFCHIKNRDCRTCSLNSALRLDEECPVDLTIELLTKIKNKELNEK